MSALTTGQLRLLRQFVEGSVTSSSGDRKEFLVINADAGPQALLAHKHFPINGPDFVHLVDAGFIRILRQHNSYMQCCCVTNPGIEYLSRAVAAAPIRFLAERSMSIVRKDLPPELRRAQELVEAAGAKLPGAKTEHELSEIGHNCREALQEFAAVAYEKWVPSEQREELPKEKNLKKLKAVVLAWKPQLGDTATALADVLVDYSWAVSNLVQKVEHRSQSQGRPLSWADVRRAVLYTYLLMAEFAEIGAECHPQRLTM
jgi:hypothetical protein